MVILVGVNHYAKMWMTDVAVEMRDTMCCCNCFCQVAVLRETVRRECEERYELTEALELAKKELLLLKRPPSRHGVLIACFAFTSNDADDDR